MVVGCGALGNEVLKNLVLLGVEHLVVVDFDIVEMGNLSRSILFLPSDAEQKRLKVEVVAERLKTINPAVEVKTICGDVVGLRLHTDGSSWAFVPYNIRSRSVSVPT